MQNLLEYIPGANSLQIGDHIYYTAQNFIEIDLPERGHLLSPWLPEQAISMVYAPRGVGKTFFALNLAHAIATGGEFLGWKAEKPRNVLFLDGEMAASDMQSRLDAIYKASPPDGYPQFYLLTPDTQKGRPMPDLATSSGQAAISEMCASVDLIIVDNIATMCRSGNENETQGWKPLQAWALSMRASGKSVLFVHHAGKGGSQRGASSREDVMDTVIELRHPKDYSPDQGAHFEVHFTKHRGFFGDDAQPLEASLTTNEDGKQKWDVKRVADSTLDRIIELMQTGISQTAIAHELGINKSTVSRHVKAAKANGRYSPLSTAEPEADNTPDSTKGDCSDKELSTVPEDTSPIGHSDPPCVTELSERVNRGASEPPGLQEELH